MLVAPTLPFENLVVPFLFLYFTSQLVSTVLCSSGIWDGALQQVFEFDGVLSC